MPSTAKKTTSKETRRVAREYTVRIYEAGRKRVYRVVRDTDKQAAMRAAKRIVQRRGDAGLILVLEAGRKKGGNMESLRAVVGSNGRLTFEAVRS